MNRYTYSDEKGLYLPVLGTIEMAAAVGLWSVCWVSPHLKCVLEILQAYLSASPGAARDLEARMLSAPIINTLLTKDISTKLLQANHPNIGMRAESTLTRGTAATAGVALGPQPFKATVLDGDTLHVDFRDSPPLLYGNDPDGIPALGFLSGQNTFVRMSVIARERPLPVGE